MSFTYTPSASSYAGAGWLERQFARTARPISDFGRAVADLLGDLFAGIYHIDRAVMSKSVDWSAPHHISVVVYGTMSTYDDSMLTRLVVLCHDRHIPCEVSGCGPRYIRLGFSPRNREGVCCWDHHPTLEAAAIRVRDNVAPAVAAKEVGGVA